jgi:hypothetical protein
MLSGWRHTRALMHRYLSLPDAAAPVPRAEHHAGDDGHDCADWNSGGACYICQKPIPVDVQLRGVGVEPIDEQAPTIQSEVAQAHDSARQSDLPADLSGRPSDISASPVRANQDAPHVAVSRDPHRLPSAWSEFGDGHDYSRTGKHDPNACRLCLQAELARLRGEAAHAEFVECYFCHQRKPIPTGTVCAECLTVPSLESAVSPTVLNAVGDLERALATERAASDRAAVTALERYGAHDGNTCSGDPCTCGFTATIEKFRGGVLREDQIR